jgi:hypothetical protein
MGWAKHVARMGEEEYIQDIGGKARRNRPTLRWILER